MAGYGFSRNQILSYPLSEGALFGFFFITIHLMLPCTMNLAVRFVDSFLVSNFLLQAIVNMFPNNFSSAMKITSFLMYLQHLYFCMYLEKRKKKR